MTLTESRRVFLNVVVLARRGEIMVYYSRFKVW